MGRPICAIGLTAALGVALTIGCGTSNSVQSPAPTTPGASASGSGAEVAAKEEQAAIDAAKRNPIATPEPRPLYPAQQPPPRPDRGLPEQAPPPRPTHGLPEQAPSSPSPDAALGAQKAAPEIRVVAPEQPPPPPFEQPPPPPVREYIWAPGYWYWYRSHYVWIGGAWMPPQRGYVYVGARWVYADDGFVFMPGGWAVSGGNVVLYPVYRHQYLDSYPGRQQRHHAWPAEHRGYRTSPRDSHRPRAWSTPRSSGGRSTNRTRSYPRGR